ncbi:MAG TPA: acetyl-CoA carboxylase biotin carboxyl carrier protein subunit [Clostridia bacterium]|nr:acetyl-CoA carboxylase biotin carboxyl carrier protein subunit [Clostridia bacterium]
MRKFKVTVDGRAYEVVVEEESMKEMVKKEAPSPVVQVEPRALTAEQRSVCTRPAAPVSTTPTPQAAPTPPATPAPRSAGATLSTGANGRKLTAPMPGVILDVKVKSGDRVEVGTVMFLLEAMKMENEIPAPWAGTVREVLVSKGSSVETGQVLAVVD